MEIPEIKTSKLEVRWHGLIGNWKTPMTKDQTMAMMNLFFFEKNPKPEAEATLTASLASVFPYQVIMKRFECLGIADKFSVSSLAFIICLCDTVGDAVMWAYTLNYIRVADNLSKVTINDVVARFPWGFPTKEERKVIWDAQKGFAMGLKCDNWVDQMDWPKLPNDPLPA